MGVAAALAIASAGQLSEELREATSVRAAAPASAVTGWVAADPVAGAQGKERVRAARGTRLSGEPPYPQLLQTPTPVSGRPRGRHAESRTS